MIIDAFMLFNELDILEFRLKLLWDDVDKFVIVEADKTFSGLEKPFYFEQHQSRFAWAKDKIHYHKIHISTQGLKLDEKPKKCDYTSDFWKIEQQQRNAIIDACAGFDDGDTLILGDLDEIPARTALAWVKQNPTALPIVCKQYWFLYDLTHLKKFSWPGSIFVSLAKARAIGAQNLRDARGWLANKQNVTVLGNANNPQLYLRKLLLGMKGGQEIMRLLKWIADYLCLSPHNILTIDEMLGERSNANFDGWHLSYFGGVAKIQEKQASFSHQELNTPELTNKDYLEACLAQRQDLHIGDHLQKVTSGFFPEYFIKAAKDYDWSSIELEQPP